MRDNESSLARLSTEREERERERWSLLRHARDEAERSLSLAAQLAAKDAHIQQLQDNLDDVRNHVRSGVARVGGARGGETVCRPIKKNVTLKFAAHTYTILIFICFLAI